MQSASRSGAERLPVDQIRVLSALVDAVAGAADVAEIYEFALDGLEAALGVERSAILLLDDEHVARFVAWRGVSVEYRALADGHFPWPVEAVDPAPLPIADVMRDPSMEGMHETFRREGIAAVAFIPLVYGHRLLGKFMLYYGTPHEFQAAELALARTLGRLIAFAVERTRVERTLREGDRRKDEFMATLAHELRNPLGALSAALELIALKQGHNTESEQAIARRQVHQLEQLIGGLLDLSRITRGVIAIRKEPVDVVEVVSRALEGVQPMIDRLRHELVVSVAPCRIVADPVRFEQIVSNLLGNAAKYTPSGGKIAVTASCESGQLVLRVRDTGVGISDELLPRVFDGFAQEHGDLARTQGGIGIGLTIARALVTLHDGTISAFSEGSGRGSEFVVTLPVGDVGDVGAHAGGPAEASTALREDDRARERRIRVLVVDDNIDMLGMLAELIRSWGHAVETETTSAGAISAVARSTPDVILLDIGLPEIDGYELARRFRAMPRLASTSLIAMSGYGQRDDIQRSYDAGFVTHLVKPIDITRLRSLLSQLGGPGPEPVSATSGATVGR